MIAKLRLVILKEILPPYAVVVTQTARKCCLGRGAPSSYQVR
jgi:hypothetical protein